MPRVEPLILRRSDRARPPTRHVSEDYNVVFRDRTIGRIWYCDYTGSSDGEIAEHLWHWTRSDLRERPGADGHADTIESAMADFRRAWDAER